MVSLQSIIWVFLLKNFSRVINLLLTKLARDRDWENIGPWSFLYCQDLGPIFSEYGPRAWLIIYIYTLQYSNMDLIYGWRIYNALFNYRNIASNHTSHTNATFL